MHSKSNRQLHEEKKLMDYLLLHELRDTRERRVILEKMFQLEVPFNISTLYEAVLDDLRVSRSTVYNSVDLYCRAGILVPVAIGDREPLYDFCDNHNIYYTCCECGRLFKVNGHELATALNLPKARGFTVTSLSIRAVGICSRCRRRLKKK